MLTTIVVGPVLVRSPMPCEFEQNRITRHQGDSPTVVTAAILASMFLVGGACSYSWQEFFFVSWFSWDGSFFEKVGCNTVIQD
jgi:hypothetical protein